MQEVEPSKSQRLTELPTPVKGIVDDIFFDLLTDQASFIYKSFRNLIRENTHIGPIITKACMISPTRDESLEWAMAYYEIFSRSAKKSGSKMLFVSKELSFSIGVESGREMEELHQKWLVSEEDEDKTNEIALPIFRLGKEQEERTKKESEENIELKYFWNVVKEYKYRSALDEDKLMEIFTPLYALRRLLYGQQESNQLKQKFG